MLRLVMVERAIYPTFTTAEFISNPVLISPGQNWLPSFARPSAKRKYGVLCSKRIKNFKTVTSEHQIKCRALLSILAPCNHTACVPVKPALDACIGRDHTKYTFCNGENIVKLFVLKKSSSGGCRAQVTDLLSDL